MKEPILIYDIALIPYSLTMEHIVELYREEKIVIYDSQNVDSTKVTPPHIINSQEEIKFKDISNEHI